MTFASFGDFLYMGGHWVEVWISWAIGVVIVGLTVVRPIRARRRFFAEERRRLARDATNESSGRGHASTTP